MNTDRHENRAEMSQFFNETELCDNTFLVQPLNAPEILKSSTESLQSNLLLQEDFMRMHRVLQLPNISNKKFIQMHASMLSKEKTRRMVDTIPAEKRKSLQEEQKIIEKDAFNLMHSKGLFGLGTSNAEEDEAIQDCLP